MGSSSVSLREAVLHRVSVDEGGLVPLLQSCSPPHCLLPDVSPQPLIGCPVSGASGRSSRSFSLLQERLVPDAFGLPDVNI